MKTMMDVLEKFYGNKNVDIVVDKCRSKREWNDFSTEFYSYVERKLSEELKVAEINIEATLLCVKYIAHGVTATSFVNMNTSRKEILKKIRDEKNGEFAFLHYFAVLVIELGLENSLTPNQKM